MALTSCGHESTRGTTLLIGESITGPWAEVGAIEVLPELNPTAVTDSCTDPYAAGDEAWAKEFKTGEFDGGEASFTVNWISGDALHKALYDEHFEGTEQTYLRIALSDVAASTRDFPYLVKGVSEPMPGGGGKMTMVISGKVNGRIIRS